jgi:hypothetical protein
MDRHGRMDQYFSVVGESNDRRFRLDLNIRGSEGYRRFEPLLTVLRIAANVCSRCIPEEWLTKLWLLFDHIGPMIANG